MPHAAAAAAASPSRSPLALARARARRRAAVAPAPASFAVGGVPALRAGSVAARRARPPRRRCRSTSCSRRATRPALAALAGAVSTPGSPRLPPLPRASPSSPPASAPRPRPSPPSSAACAPTGLDAGRARPERALARACRRRRAAPSRAFGVSLRRYRERGGRTVFANTAAPRLPPALHGAVTDVLGLDDVPRGGARRPDPARARVLARAAARSRRRRPAAPGAVRAGQRHAPPDGPYTIDQIADAYGFGGLYAAATSAPA